LNADLIDQMLTPQVDQMGSLLVVRQVRTDAIDDGSAYLRCLGYPVCSIWEWDFLH
jgi:hypothetical protein